ncbi:MAG: hypothetical protein ACJLUP_16770 [Agrobacterium tumefaciens]
MIDTAVRHEEYQSVRNDCVSRDVARHLGEVIRGKRVHDLSCDPRVKLAVAFVVGVRSWQTRWATDAEVWQWLGLTHRLAVMDFGPHPTFGDLSVDG